MYRINNDTLIKWAGYLLLLLSLGSVSLTKYIPSLDGPQHLHTIHVLTELIKGNEFIGQYYVINSLPVGYWIAHFIIGIFHLILPSWAAEKAYLYVYIIGMFFSFRFLIMQISNKKANASSLFIFPFMFSSYQLMGYYSFSFAAIFYFWGIAYTIKSIDKPSFKNSLVLSLLAIGQFFSHALVFTFFCFSIAIIYLARLIRNEDSLKNWIINAGKIILGLLPALLLWINYLLKVMHLDNTIKPSQLPIKEQLSEFFRIKLLVGFSHTKESFGYKILFILLVLLVILSLIHYVKSHKLQAPPSVIKTLFQQEHVFLIIALVFLSLYFWGPNRISAGSLTNRFGLYFFFNLIIWLGLKPFKPGVQWITIISIVSVFIYTRQLHIQNYKYHQLVINEVKEIEEQIPENSLVYHTIESMNWMDKHFPLYVGTDKSMVNVRNPQCWGHFPVVWNFMETPQLVMGNTYKTPISKGLKSQNTAIDTISYQIIYNQKAFWSSSAYQERQALLKNYYEPVYISSKELVALYRIRN